MVSAPVPPMMVSMLADRDGVGAIGEGERVAAGAEIDGAAGEGGAEGDDVGAGAADEGVDVADGAGVGGVAPRVSLLVPVPRSIDMAVVSAVPG